MKTVIATDVSLFVCNGRYYYALQVSTILKRYYSYFGKLTVFGRVKNTDKVMSSCEDVTDMIEEVVSLSSLGKVMLGRYDKKIEEVVKKSDLVICRCPGVIAHRAADFARKYKKTCFAESMGCAWDAYWNHGIVGKIIAPYMFFKMKQTVRHADYALYVTSEFLQKRYPCRNESIGVSNVLIENIDEEVLQKRLENIKKSDYSSITLMTTAAVDVRYKGQEYVIKAIPALNKAGIRVRYLLVGGGDKSYLEGIAKKCGVEDQVEFLGRRLLSEVFEILDAADIYIQPSLQEGLPRSVIEAMSRGCPVIGARTAGIPELIDSSCVVRRKSAKDIAKAVMQIADRENMTHIARRNFEEAKGYLDGILSEKRNLYFQRMLEERGGHE